MFHGNAFEGTRLSSRWFVDLTKFSLKITLNTLVTNTSDMRGTKLRAIILLRTLDFICIKADIMRK